MQLIINLFFLGVILHQILFWVWYWQLKEYRWDRFSAGFSWKFLWQQFDLRSWWRPIWTARALLSFFLAMVLNFGVVLAPITCALAVGLVTPPFVLWKRILVWRAKRKMESFNGVVVGVTGSYGKSMTKELLAQVLGSRFRVLATQGNNNTEIGVAQTVLKRLKGDEDFFIVEMGAYKIGEIKAICGFVKPKIGIISGIGDQHLELFGSLENIRWAKMELIESLSKEGFGLVAGDDFRLADAKNLQQFKDHLTFSFGNQKYSIPLLGRELARNVIGVIMVARRTGMTSGEISAALGMVNTKNIYPRLVKGKGEITIIDNSYNNSLESFLSALKYLEVWKGFKRIVVTSGLIEVGKNAKVDWEKIKDAARDVTLIDTRVEKNFKPMLGENTVILLQGRCPTRLKQSLFL